jgi:hypothetical protein
VALRAAARMACLVRRLGLWPNAVYIQAAQQRRSRLACRWPAPPNSKCPGPAPALPLPCPCSRCEVIGLLGGTFDPERRVLAIQEAYPCRRAEGLASGGCLAACLPGRLAGLLLGAGIPAS